MSRIRVFDFESTGKMPPEHGLVEIGWCDLVSRGTDLVGAPCDWEVQLGSGILCNPGRDIPPVTAAVHNIIDEDVRDRPHWKRELRALIEETTGLGDELIALAAHSIDAEQAWFVDDIVAPKPWICTYRVSLRFWPEAPAHSNAGLRYWRMPSGLSRLIASPQHRAGSDAYVTAHLLRDMLNQSCSLEQMFAWSLELPLTVRCFIGDYRRDGDGTPWAEVDSSMLRWILGKDFKPEVMHTARYHLDRRIEQAREAEERMRLNAQLQAAGLPEEPIDETTIKLAEQAPRQESFL